MEECSTNYVKDCQIHYEKGTRAEKVEVCRESVVRDCDVQGPIICSTEPTSGIHEKEIIGTADNHIS